MKTGLYFGSFNPVHLGHLAIANYLTDSNEVDEVWFVISPHNPLKESEGLIDSRERVMMVNLAIIGMGKLKASEIELSMPLPSYTIDTLNLLSDRFPGRVFSIIMGEDNLDTLHKWKEIDTILSNYEILVYPRLGDTINGKLMLSRMPADARIRVINAPLHNISASDIRIRIANGEDVSHMVHPSTLEYIRKRKLYR